MWWCRCTAEAKGVLASQTSSLLADVVVSPATVVVDDADGVTVNRAQHQRCHSTGPAARLVRRVKAGTLRTEAGSPGEDNSRSDYIGSTIPAAVRQRDTALRTLDRSVKDGTLQARGAETVERLLGVGSPQSRSWSARWAATTGDPHYLRAVSKKLTDPENGQLLWTTEESEAWRSAAAVQAERSMSTVDTSGGFLIPMQLDPAILLSSSGSANPLRQMARVVQTVGDVWYGVSSDGVDAHWYAEAAEVSDDSPALLQPAIPCYRGSAWVPYSIEIEGDGSGFVTEVGRLLADSVAQLTATAYVTGSGTGEPTGFITALAGGASVVDGDGSEVLADTDPYLLQNALPPRFQANSQWGAALPTINELRQAETSNGALKFPSLQDTPPTLLGRAMNEISNMDAALNAAATEDNYLLVLGDWSQMVITDRAGSTIELVPHVFGSSHRPTGQRGFFCWFRTGSDVLVDNAFRMLNVATTA